jgi:hypothetical protein
MSSSSPLPTWRSRVDKEMRKFERAHAAKLASPGFIRTDQWDQQITLFRNCLLSLGCKSHDPLPPNSLEDCSRQWRNLLVDPVPRRELNLFAPSSPSPAVQPEPKRPRVSLSPSSASVEQKKDERFTPAWSSYFNSESFLTDVGGICVVCQSFPDKVGMMKAGCCGSLVCFECMGRWISQQMKASFVQVSTYGSNMLTWSADPVSQWLKIKIEIKCIMKCPNFSIAKVGKEFDLVRRLRKSFQQANDHSPVQSIASMTVGIPCSCSRASHVSDEEWLLCEERDWCLACPLSSASAPCAGFHVKWDAVIADELQRHLFNECTAQVPCRECEETLRQDNRIKGSWMMKVKHVALHHNMHKRLAALCELMMAPGSITSDSKEYDMWWHNIRFIFSDTKKICLPGDLKLRGKLTVNKNKPTAWKEWVDRLRLRVVASGNDPEWRCAKIYPWLFNSAYPLSDAGAPDEEHKESEEEEDEIDEIEEDEEYQMDMSPVQID